jgi:hypothetical protein
MKPVFARLMRRTREALNDGRLAFWLVVLIGVAWEAQALFMVSDPVRAAGARPFIVDDFGAGAAVGQTFRMPQDGLESIRLRFFADRPTRLDVRCKLLTWGGGGGRDPWAGFYEWTATVDLPRGNSWQRFRFTPVAASQAVVFQFRVQKLKAQALESDASGSIPRLGLVGSLDDSLKDGNVIDGSTQITDQDLFFEAQADDSAFSTFRRNANARLPAPLRSKGLQFAILTAFNLAFAGYLYELFVAGPRAESSPAPSLAALR